MPRRTEMLSSIHRVRFKKLAFCGGGGRRGHRLVRLPAGLRRGPARKRGTRQAFRGPGAGRALLPESTGAAAPDAAARAVRALNRGHRARPLAALPGETGRRLQTASRTHPPRISRPGWRCPAGRAERGEALGELARAVKAAACGQLSRRLSPGWRDRIGMPGVFAREPGSVFLFAVGEVDGLHPGRDPVERALAGEGGHGGRRSGRRAAARPLSSPLSRPRPTLWRSGTWASRRPPPVSPRLRRRPRSVRSRSRRRSRGSCLRPLGLRCRWWPRQR